MEDCLTLFERETAAWFRKTLGEPTQVQEQSWGAIAAVRGSVVHDDRTRRRKHAAPAFAREHEIERLRRCDQDMGRPARHPAPLALIGIPGTDADCDELFPSDADKRFFQVLFTA